jgi:hypothetical protein
MFEGPSEKNPFFILNSFGMFLSFPYPRCMIIHITIQILFLWHCNFVGFLVMKVLCYIQNN